MPVRISSKLEREESVEKFPDKFPKRSEWPEKTKDDLQKLPWYQRIVLNVILSNPIFKWWYMRQMRKMDADDAESDKTRASMRAMFKRQHEEMRKSGLYTPEEMREMGIKDDE